MADSITDVKRAATLVREAESKLKRATAHRDQKIVKAQADGATYPALAEAAGVSRGRITQVLLKHRNPTN